MLHISFTHSTAHGFDVGNKLYRIILFDLALFIMYSLPVAATGLIQAIRDAHRFCQSKIGMISAERILKGQSDQQHCVSGYLCCLL